MKKKIKEKVNRFTIELTEDQLIMISRALEFVSRFSCGQIGHTYLPPEIQEIFYIKDKDNHIDWIESNRRRNQYDAAGGLIKSSLYPELNPLSHESYGVNKSDYADNLYDIYKMINHTLHKYDTMNTAPDEISYNINSNFMKFGSLPNIKVNKIDEKK
jgi:hypothetical protein